MPNINVAINGSGAVKGAAMVNRALGSIGSSTKNLISGAFNPLNATIASLASGATVVGLAKIADTYTVIDSQLQNIVGTAQDAAYVQEDLHEISRQTGTSLKDNADSYVKLAQAQKLTGLTSEENVKIIGALNGLMIQTGTSGAQASAAMLQLSQALTSGQLSGDEFRSMAENAPGVLNRMSEAMGIARKDLKKMSSEGKLTSDLLGKALLEIAESGEVAFEELPKTVAKGWNSVVIEFQKAWDKINDETGIMGSLSDGLESVANWIEDNSWRFTVWIDNLVNVISAQWPGIKSAFGELSLALLNLVTGGNHTQVTMESVGEAIAGLVEKIRPTINVLTTLVGWLQKAIDLTAKYGPLSMVARAAGAAIGTIEAGNNQNIGGRADVFDVIGAGINAAVDPIVNSGGGNGTTVNNYITTPANKDIVRDISQMQKQQAAML